MKAAPDGLPLEGDGIRGSCLRVRASPNAAKLDVGVDATGNVLLDRRGLSVSDDWRQLEGFLIPEHLNDGLNAASGKNMRVFTHGSGPFVEGAVASGLELLFKPNSRTTGVVAPDGAVSLADYQDNLVSTRLNWVIDES